MYKAAKLQVIMKFSNWCLRITDALQCDVWHCNVKYWNALHRTWTCVSLNNGWTSCLSRHYFVLKNSICLSQLFIWQSEESLACLYIFSIKKPSVSRTAKYNGVTEFWNHDVWMSQRVWRYIMFIYSIVVYVCKRYSKIMIEAVDILRL